MPRRSSDAAVVRYLRPHASRSRANPRSRLSVRSPPPLAVGCLTCPAVPAESSLFLAGSPDSCQPSFESGTSPYPASYPRHASWSPTHRRLGFLSPFGCRHSLLGHPLPAGELGLPHGRLTTRHHRCVDPNGVATFRTHKTR